MTKNWKLIKWQLIVFLSLSIGVAVVYMSWSLVSISFPEMTKDPQIKFVFLLQIIKG
jgi:hypothetical protein